MQIAPAHKKRTVWRALLLLCATLLLFLAPVHKRATAHEHGRTLLLVLHDLNLAAAYADHLVMMRDGQIVTSGPPTDVFTSANLKRVFDLDANILHDPTSGSPVCVPYTPASGEVAL